MKLKIEIAHCLPNEQAVLSLTLEAGCTVRDALMQSGFIQRYSLGDIDTLAVGIYGKKAPLETLLKHQDRVEVYRPLTLSPIEARHLRAKRTAKASKPSAQ